MEVVPGLPRTYHLCKENELARDKYVAKMHLASLPGSKQCVVHTAESYIHHHYKRHNDSLYYPNDVKGIPTK
ncbi:hypothetical protein H310_04888 [Aphanomyces invadans]|uniref:Uncharacterized protein n=1 Tax=Aphanomyces invadans TaxID=157072 RepID=A0A024UCV2_9STRA|nr:hypothetical protein H310_04888 [Aphanomyces invadans]ETW03423.1 hypothetical protein H310_04888 [Aphanomyces invadans]|eukprot:XP_008867652.1 hypothetical protein H310_04888 [Aphanomyces invadans]